MLIKYKGKQYEVYELVEPVCSKEAGATSDILAIFELRGNSEEVQPMRLINWGYGARFTSEQEIIRLIEKSKNPQHFV